MYTPDEEDVIKKFREKLVTLKINSKPIITSIAKMAEYYVKHAPIVVGTIEKHLMKVDPSMKLPILYLIDSIVKNVKKDYVGLFGKDIVSVFCSVFELVDDGPRAKMYKLRHTWNAIFPAPALYRIDLRAHQIDPTWPITSRKSTSPEPEPNEAELREQLMLKQKEFMELRQKRLELELFQAKAKLAEQARLKQVQEDETAKQALLLKQAEMAKHQTDRAAAIMAMAATSSNTTSAATTLTQTAPNPRDPRLNRLKEKRQPIPYVPTPTAAAAARAYDRNSHIVSSSVAPAVNANANSSSSSSSIYSTIPSLKSQKTDSSSSSSSRKRRDPRLSRHSQILSDEDIVMNSAASLALATTHPLLVGDVDLRFEVETSAEVEADLELEPQPPKKPKSSSNANTPSSAAELINDLFGRHDVDLRTTPRLATAVTTLPLPPQYPQPSTTASRPATNFEPRFQHERLQRPLHLQPRIVAGGPQLSKMTTKMLPESRAPAPAPVQPLTVEDLLSKLLKAGILQPSAMAAATATAASAATMTTAPNETTTTDSVAGVITKASGPAKTDQQQQKLKVNQAPAPKSSALKKIPEIAVVAPAEEELGKKYPPLPTIDVGLKDNLRERRVKLVNQICTGVQCSSCGLRFAPDQTSRYKQHLDWHFRQNRRDKGNSRKALSRNWYYQLSDWIQFEEVADLEERAASTFEFHDSSAMDVDKPRSGATTPLNPDDFTVLAGGHVNDTCPQCGEDFDTFYDDEEEEWRLRNAVAILEQDGDSDSTEISRLYHPNCHQDYLAASQMDLESPEPQLVAGTENCLADEMEPEEEEEVLFIKEGKKEIVVMNIDVDVDEEEEQQRVTTTTTTGPNLATTQSLTSATISSSGLGVVVAVNSEKNIIVDKLELEKNEKENDIKNPSEKILLPSPPPTHPNLDLDLFNNRSILSPITIHDDDDNEGEGSKIPGIVAAAAVTSAEGAGATSVFEFALRPDNVTPPEEQQPKTISYKNWQFDFPRIKVEPPGWEDFTEDQVIFSKDFSRQNDDEIENPVDITGDESMDEQLEQSLAQKNGEVDVDLTLEDQDDSSSSHQPRSPVAQIDGNLEFKGFALKPQSTLLSKMKINIEGLSPSPSASPKRSNSKSPLQTSQQENRMSSLSPNSRSHSAPAAAASDISQDSTDSALTFVSSATPSPSKTQQLGSAEEEAEVEAAAALEEMKRLKPRLVGKKLVNCPPKTTKGEESGLCVIC